MGALSRFIAPRALSTFAQVGQALRDIQAALDRATRTNYVGALAVQDMQLACPGFYRVSPPAAGIRATLPRASEDNAGEQIEISIEGAIGSMIVFAPPGQTIAGSSKATFTANGLIILYSNGVNAWVLVNQLAVEAPLPATILPGLSVLGRAPNSAGVQAAITATAPFQHLRENAAGTSLEWSLLTSGDFGAGVVPLTALPAMGSDTVLGNITAGAASPVALPLANFAGAGLGFASHAFLVNVGPSLAIAADNVVRAALTGDVTAAQDSNATAFRAFGAKSVLANATNASAVPSDLAGSAAFQHLRVNSANTALEWSLLTSGDFPANVVPLAALPTMTAQSVLANATNATATPTNFAGTSALQYLRRNAANTALEWGTLPVDPLPTIQPGSFLGLQITAGGAATAIEITGANAGESIRWDSWVIDAASAGNLPDYSVPAGTTGVRLTGVAVNFQGFIGTGGALDGHPFLISPQSGHPGVTFEHESASEATAARRLQLPGGLTIRLFERENALVFHDSSATRHRLFALARARHAVQANGGAISPAETLNFTNATLNDILVTATVASPSGVATITPSIAYAAQATLDQGIATTFPLTAALRGFPPNVAQNTTAIRVINSVAANPSTSYTIPVSAGKAGSCYLLWGFFSVIRGATATASTLTWTASCAGTIRSEIPGVPIPVAVNTRYGGLMLSMLHIETAGAGGTATLRSAGIAGSLASVFVDLASSGATLTPFAFNTTVTNVISLGMTMSVAVAGLETCWNSCGVMRIN